jgi:hypothetical protein
VTGSAKRKGDSAELEAAAMLSDLLGFGVRRQLGAGRADDVGDLTGIPATVVQVANRPSDTLRAVREKPLEAEVQRGRAGATFAATMVRLRGGAWRVVLTPEQFATLLREALTIPSSLTAVTDTARSSADSDP